MNIITSEGGLNLLTEDGDVLITEQDELGAGIIHASGSFGVVGSVAGSIAAKTAKASFRRSQSGSGGFGAGSNGSGAFGSSSNVKGSI